MGDLRDNELRPFLSFLADSIASPPAQARFRALWESEAALAALRQRYGGYVSDLVALRNANIPVDAADESDGIPGAWGSGAPGGGGGQTRCARTVSLG
jgi:hypothetical protein